MLSAGALWKARASFSVIWKADTTCWSQCSWKVAYYFTSINNRNLYSKSNVLLSEN